MGFRRALLHIAGRVVQTPVLGRWARPYFRYRINIVYYHSTVSRAYATHGFFHSRLTLDQLDRDISLLKRFFRIVPLSALLAEPMSEPALDRPQMAITFDDGFDLVADGVMSILDRHDVKGSCFVITSCVDNDDLMWRHKLRTVLATGHGAACLDAYNRILVAHGCASVRRAEDIIPASSGWPMERKDDWANALWDASGMPSLSGFLAEYRPYFPWTSIEEWLAHGHEIGLHTATHPFCSRLNTAQIRAEIVEPAARLKRRLQLPHVPLSYPFGDRLPAAAEQYLVREGIVSCAMGIAGLSSRSTPLWALDRVGAEPGLSEALLSRPASAVLKGARI